MLIHNTPWHFSCARCGFGMLTACLLSFVICHCHSETNTRSLMMESLTKSPSRVR